MAERGYEDIKQKGRKLWEALKSDPVNHDYIRDLLYEEGAPPNFREPGCETNRTPLHFVVCERKGDEDLMDMLLENGADANLVDCFNLTPLHLAAEKGNLQAVKILLTNPFSQAERNTPNRENETPLQIADKNGHHGVVSYLRTDSQCGVLLPGVSNVEVAKGGSTVSIIGAVNVMVGDYSKMNINN